jgi:Dihydrodipicolinate synthetase family
MSGLRFHDWPHPVLDTLRRGTVIPAHPLALDASRKLDAVSQRALSRYYMDAGAGGLAVGVHTTQFQIREAGLYRPVLELAAETTRNWSRAPIVMIAGVMGRTVHAVAEARVARDLGYHAALLGLAAMREASEDELIAHCSAVAAEMPLVGFYLQTAVGGIKLSRSFWTRFAAIENVVAIKVAPFNRYRTLDVMHGVIAAGAEDRIMLYTGNDDHIVADLALPFVVKAGGREATLRFRGGLLGHWSVWVKAAVNLLERIHALSHGAAVPADLLALDAAVTDCNAAIFDVDNEFHGCIAGCHYILNRQGLMQSVHCLDPQEDLSPGQAARIDELYSLYPHLTDDAFVAANLTRWRS